MAVPIWLVPIGKQIFSFITDFFNNKKEMRQAEHTTHLAIEASKQKLIVQRMSNEHALNVERSKNTSKNCKTFSILVWFGPYIVNLFYPEYARQIFENMQGAPLWYMQSCMTIMFAVWTISVSKDTVRDIFRNLGNYMKGRRAFRVQRKVVYDMLRIAVKRPLVKEEVDTLNPILSYIEKEANK